MDMQIAALPFRSIPRPGGWRDRMDDPLDIAGPVIDFAYDPSSELSPPGTRSSASTLDEV